jgi:hypothetical protein
MKSRVLPVVLSAALLASPLLAGALLLRVADPQTNREAQAKHAIVMAQMTSCHSPERTVVSATAEGILAGKRTTLPLKVIKLSTPGMFAVAQEWPSEGVWVVRMVVANPEYKDYATGLVVPVSKDTWIRASAKEFFRAPTDDDVSSALKQTTLEQVHAQK